MYKRKITLDKKGIESLRKGNEILDLSIFSELDGKKSKYNFLVNDTMHLRIERKPLPKIDRKLKEYIYKIKNPISFRSELNRICELNNQIIEKINRSTTRNSGSSDGFEDFYTNLERRWKNIQKKESEFKINLLKKDKIGYCSFCRQFRQISNLLKEKKSEICTFCNKPIKQTKNYYSLPESLAQYLKGFWFEDYVSKQLENLGWTALPSMYIYGSSGVKFEIDILAIKDGKTLLIECKSGGSGLGISDFASFSSKFTEIKTRSAIFISLNRLNPDIHKISTNTGIHIIDKITNTRDLIRKIKKFI